VSSVPLLEPSEHHEEFQVGDLEGSSRRRTNLRQSASPRSRAHTGSVVCCELLTSGLFFGWIRDRSVGETWERRSSAYLLIDSCRAASNHPSDEGCGDDRYSDQIAVDWAIGR